MLGTYISFVVKYKQKFISHLLPTSNKLNTLYKRCLSDKVTWELKLIQSLRLQESVYPNSDIFMALSALSFERIPRITSTNVW